MLSKPEFLVATIDILELFVNNAELNATGFRRQNMDVTITEGRHGFTSIISWKNVTLSSTS